MSEEPVPKKQKTDENECSIFFSTPVDQEPSPTQTTSDNNKSREWLKFDKDKGRRKPRIGAEFQADIPSIQAESFEDNDNRDPS